MNDLLTTIEVSELLGVSTQKLHQWKSDGELDVNPEGPGNKRLWGPGAVAVALKRRDRKRTHRGAIRWSSINEILNLPRLPKIRARFEASYIPEPMSGCWLWEKGMSNNRGLIGFGSGKKEVHLAFPASRVSWVLHKGPIPDGLLVCHHCDNGMCVNPDHLFLGTYRDNSHDMIRKKRHPSRMLLPGEVADAVGRRATGETYQAIGDSFGVSSVAIFKHVKATKN